MGVSPVMLLVKTPVPVPSVVLLSKVVGSADVLQQTPLKVTEAPPSSVIFPPLEAVVEVMAEGLVVLSVGVVGNVVVVVDVVVGDVVVGDVVVVDVVVVVARAIPPTREVARKTNRVIKSFVVFIWNRFYEKEHCVTLKTSTRSIDFVSFLSTNCFTFIPPIIEPNL